LIAGETGVGKELLAQAIHRASRRSKGPFVPVNMLALSQTLFESEFFGHAKGSFTGADRDKKGYLGKSGGGTLFLDEIGDLQMEIQGKLLRILQEGEYTPVGKTRSETADVRFVAATNQDLEKLVEEKRFRMDLFYRLQFAHLRIPPLRERPGDVPLLAARFLETSQGPGASLTEEAEAMLCGHDWPGNVRELKGVLEAASNLAEKGRIAPEHIRLSGRTSAVPVDSSWHGTEKRAGRLEPLVEIEKRHILRVYEAVGRNKTRAAKVLEIGLQTLHRKLKAYRDQGGEGE
ncbi:MAG: sigma-54-dependent Fis family transcriptional regulator, partial [Deltaproteobacteria bacterium]|nr:sigma-54-dependent Fis family transcriptional regulator [Deltaproteobacteria bacterium]